MVMSRAPISRSTRITCPFAAIAALAASVIIAAEAAAISISENSPSTRSRLAALTSGSRQRVWSSSTAPGASPCRRRRSASASNPSLASVTSIRRGTGSASTGTSGPNQGSSSFSTSSSGSRRELAMPGWS